MQVKHIYGEISVDWKVIRKEIGNFSPSVSLTMIIHATYSSGMSLDLYRLNKPNGYGNKLSLPD
jgi:hypothetical protein